MSIKKLYAITVCSLLLFFSAKSQDLTGTWEGEMGTYQFLQINIIQNGDKICGYTWDHITYNQQDFCKAFFVASFNKTTHKMFLSGTSFIANSGGHVLMQLQLYHKYVNNEAVLYHNPTAAERMQAIILGQEVETRIYLKKTSDKPSKILPQMQECLNEKKKGSSKSKIITQKPKDSIITKKTTPPPPADSITKKKNIIKPIDSARKILLPDNKPVDSSGLYINPERTNKEQAHIEVNVNKINLKVYDNAIVDGDTVSIYYNGRLLLSHQPLTEKPINIDLTLDVTQPRHEIVLFAENLGTIVPNTALVVVTAGDKRYELFASANLQQNAVLVFTYKPNK